MVGQFRDTRPGVCRVRLSQGAMQNKLVDRALAVWLLITADGGGSNGVRVRLWKVVLRKLSDELGLTIHMRHFPPGTCRWNEIEHRMFCHMTENWTARSPIDYLTVVHLVGQAETSKGFTIQAELDESQSETGKEVSDEEMARLRITRCTFHGEWNCSLAP